MPPLENGDPGRGPCRERSSASRGGAEHPRGAAAAPRVIAEVLGADERGFGAAEVAPLADTRHHVSEIVIL